MIFSLNEIEAMARRAVRGAGRDWGIAEEAGKAARWLAAHGLPGPELLAALLTFTEGKSYDAIAPNSVDGLWQAKSGHLCPLITGAALSDHAAQVGAGRVFEFGAIAFPLLLAPYGASTARSLGTAIELSWPGVTLTASPDDGLAIKGKRAAVIAPAANHVHCRPAGVGALTLTATERGRAVDTGDWSCLSAFAHRTYAPATEASRALGAG